MFASNGDNGAPCGIPLFGCLIVPSGSLIGHFVRNGFCDVSSILTYCTSNRGQGRLQQPRSRAADIDTTPLYNTGFLINRNLFPYLCCTNETLAQSVEHTPFKRRVEGSNPSCLTTFIYAGILNNSQNTGIFYLLNFILRN